jgi:hypothetical protein
MPDITMCPGGNCPMRETCYRYKAKPNDPWQSYFTETPFKMIEGKIDCDHYMELYNKKKNNESLDT